MATEFTRFGADDSMPAAVSPAPTVAALPTVRQRARNVAWLIALVLGPAVAFAQTRAGAGEIQPPATPALVQPEGGAAPKPEDHQRRPAAVKQPIHKPPQRTQDKSQTEPKLQLAAQTRLKGDHKAGPSDRTQQPVAGKVDAAGMEARWQEIQTTLRPARLIVLCVEFERDFPSSQFVQQVKVAQAGARQAMEIQRSAGLSGDLFEDPVGDSGYHDNLIKAVRGDKEAAYGIALAHWTGTSGVVPSTRRTEQWLRFAAELGNGRASWELAQMYNRVGLVADAARFEKKALDLGYQPPPRLPTRGY